MKVVRRGESMHAPRAANVPMFDLIDDDALCIIASYLQTTKRSNFARTCKRFLAMSHYYLGIELNLSNEQLVCFLDAMRGANVFITGAAGSGKSHLLKAIIRCLGRENVAVTASTGCAAAVIGASTFHSTCALGLGKAPAKVIVKRIVEDNIYAYRRIRSLKTLVVDEVGMLTGNLFDKAGQVLGSIRRIIGFDYSSMMKNAQPILPFDTVQLILCGDALQLPPVDHESDGWIFEAKCWKELDLKVHVLKNVHRQQDVRFIQTLQRIRLGQATISDLSYLIQNSAKTPMENALKLYAVNAPADYENETRLAQLPGESHRFCSIDTGTNPNVPDEYVQDLLKHCLAPRVLVLKRGARVMCLKNITPDLVNGSIGTVKQFSFCRNEAQSIIQVHVTVEFDGQLGQPSFTYTFSTHIIGREVNPDLVFTVRGQDHKKLAQRIQLPLRLAWAVSIHKSQGKRY